MSIKLFSKLNILLGRSLATCKCPCVGSPQHDIADHFTESGSRRRSKLHTVPGDQDRPGYFQMGEFGAPPPLLHPRTTDQRPVKLPPIHHPSKVIRHVASFRRPDGRASISTNSNSLRKYRTLHCVRSVLRRDAF